MPKKSLAVDAKQELVLPRLLRKLRGEAAAEDFYPKYGLRISTGRNWEYGRNVPKLEVFFGIVKMLGFEGLKELGYNLGEIMDVLRGDMSEARREAHHWVDEIFDHRHGVSQDTQDRVLRDLRRTGGQSGPKGSR